MTLPLVLVHGYTGSALDFSGVVPRLERSRPVHAWTQRGHAGGPHESPYTLEVLAQDLGEALSGLGRVHLLGHSMGGAVVLRHALARPGSLASLVLMDTTAEAFGLGGDAFEDLAARVERDGMAPVLAANEEWMSSAPAWVQERVRGKLKGMDPRAWVELGRDMRREPRLLDRVGELAVPVTVLVGEADTGFLGPSQRLSEAIRGSQLTVLPGGHSPQEDDPDAWCAAVEEHLRWAEGA